MEDGGWVEVIGELVEEVGIREGIGELMMSGVMV